MSLKKTLIISAFLHIFFFAAALLLSASISGRYEPERLLRRHPIPRGNGKQLNEKMFFVKLTEDINKSGNMHSALKTKIQKPEKPRRVKTQKKPVPVETGRHKTMWEKTVFIEATVRSEEPVRLQLTKGQTNDPPSPPLVKKDEEVLRLSAEQDGNGSNIREEYANNILLKGSESSGNKAPDSFSSGNGAASASKSKGMLSRSIIEAIRNSIEKATIYPVLARRRGMEGIVYVSFMISPLGKPHDIKILKSSGHLLLDNTTLNIVKKAGPFPHIESSVEIPVVFRLKGWKDE